MAFAFVATVLVAFAFVVFVATDLVAFANVDLAIDHYLTVTDLKEFPEFYFDLIVVVID